jgi:hypothetical protein
MRYVQRILPLALVLSLVMAPAFAYRDGEEPMLLATKHGRVNSDQ